MRTPGRTALLLVIVTALFYAPTVNYGWVYEDANDLPALTRPLSDLAEEWRWKPARSLTQITMTGTYQVFGLWPGVYHAGNVLIHLVNGGLLYGLATACLSPWAAVLALGVFLLHPVQVESVAYVSNRADLLATTALLLGLFAVNARRWIFVALACVAAFLAKETMVVAPALFALYAYWRGVRLPPWVFVALSPIVVALVTLLAFDYAPVLDGELILTQLTSWTYLLSLLVWPSGLTMDPDWNWITPMAMSGVAGLWTALLLIAWNFRDSPFALALVWSLIVVSPRFFVPLVEGLHEHHLYVAVPLFALWIGAVVAPRKDGYVSETFA